MSKNINCCVYRRQLDAPLAVMLSFDWHDCYPPRFRSRWQAYTDTNATGYGVPCHRSQVPSFHANPLSEVRITFTAPTVYLCMMLLMISSICAELSHASWICFREILWSKTFTTLLWCLFSGQNVIFHTRWKSRLDLQMVCFFQNNILFSIWGREGNETLTSDIFHLGVSF